MTRPSTGTAPLAQATNDKSDPLADLPMSESLRALARRGDVHRYRAG